jgi:hypothetical protein
MYSTGFSDFNQFGDNAFEGVELGGEFIEIVVALDQLKNNQAVGCTDIASFMQAEAGLDAAAKSGKNFLEFVGTVQTLIDTDDHDFMLSHWFDLL